MFATPRSKPPLLPVSPEQDSNTQCTQQAVQHSFSSPTSPPPKPSAAGTNKPQSWGTLFPTGRLAQTVLASRFDPILLTNSVFRIGRSSASQLTINDLTVSSRHCSLMMDEAKNSPCIADHRSSNGTFVNGIKLDADRHYYLAHGDVISLVSAPATEEEASGLEVKRLRISSSAAAEQRPSFTLVFHQTPAPQPGIVASNMVNDADSVRRAPKAFTKDFGLISELGRGNFATVYRAVCRHTGEHVAVKVIEKQRFLNMSASRFKAQIKEAEVLSRISHPYIVSFRALVRTEDSFYVVTELLSGGELFERLVNFGAYAEPRAKLLIRRVCEALAYLHERGVVHRDVKPENICLQTAEDDVCCKLVDFGVATEIKGTGGSKTFCGSLSYVAPEVLKRRSSVNKQGTYGSAVDIWSLGVTMHVVLSLRPPFDEEENSQMHEALDFVLRFDTPEWQAISREAKDFITRCLELDETKRMTAAQALTHKWLRDSSV